ncbi:MAG: imidazoleglycerol-phosphate dehydratase HisB [Nitrososphaerales archaeon]
MANRVKQRIAEIETETKETKIRAEVNLDGTGKSRVSTGTKFLDHMLASLSTHSLIDIDLRATGDLRHHIIEDCAIALGRCLSKALGDRSGIVRFGSAMVPMDEALAFASLDLVKRTYFAMSDLELRRTSIEDLPREDLEHFFRSLCDSFGCTMHLGVECGSNDHHKVEACFKALALSLRRAVERDPRRLNSATVPSSKGSM